MREKGALLLHYCLKHSFEMKLLRIYLLIGLGNCEYLADLKFMQPSTVNTASSLSTDASLLFRVPALKTGFLRMGLPRKAGRPTKTRQHGFVIGCHVVKHADFVRRKPLGNNPHSKWDECYNQYRKSWNGWKTSVMMQNLNDGDHLPIAAMVSEMATQAATPMS